MPRKRRKKDKVDTPAVEESAVAELLDPADVTCPKVPVHGAGRFYHADGADGYFVCDVCGHEWTAHVRYLESLTDYCLLMAESLEKAPTQPDGEGVQCILWDGANAKEAARTLRRLALKDPQVISPSDVRRYRVAVKAVRAESSRPSLAEAGMGGEPAGLFARLRGLLPGFR